MLTAFVTAVSTSSSAEARSFAPTQVHGANAVFVFSSILSYLRKNLSYFSMFFISWLSTRQLVTEEFSSFSIRFFCSSSVMCRKIFTITYPSSVSCLSKVQMSSRRVSLVSLSISPYIKAFTVSRYQLRSRIRNSPFFGRLCQ